LATVAIAAGSVVASSVTLTGGTINGVVIGTTTADLGTFTDLRYGTLAASSDGRLKRNVTGVSGTESLRSILAMRPVSYFWNAGSPSATDKSIQLGFIAQELKAALSEELAPSMVLEDNKGFFSVQYSKLTPLLAGAVAEQQRMIAAQQVTIDSTSHLAGTVTEQQRTIDGLHDSTSHLAGTVEKQQRMIDGLMDMATSQKSTIDSMTNDISQLMMLLSPEFILNISE
jgi:uncharacterized coiled-coil protein SlyX